MNTIVVKAHFQRALDILDSFEKTQESEYLINGLIITLCGHLRGGVDRLDTFFRKGEDEHYANDLMQHLYRMNSHIKEAIAFIQELVVPRMAMRDLPTDIRMGDKEDLKNDISSIGMVRRTVKYAIEDLDEMIKK
jgi:hypothetical protein